MHVVSFGELKFHYKVIPENFSLINQFLVEIKNAPSSSHIDALELYDIAAPPPLFEIIPNSFMSVTAFG
jgi:hypothetical protein